MEHEREEIMRITARYAEEAQEGRSPSLSAYLARYPQYREELLDFISYYQAFEAPLPMNTSLASLSEVSREALERAYTSQAQLPTQDVAVRSLFESRQQQPVTPRQLADVLELSEDIVQLLERRALLPGSIPATLSQCLAGVLGYSPAAIEAFFASREPSNTFSRPGLKVAEPRGPYGENQESLTFAQAVAASAHLSSERKAAWLERLS
ncbi:hypothetical protein [Ktedonobacter robiniae]|uniref:Uncharacterized protein n=1 Tax=Ktedonobacter robiniae TaxID=2778365 RepID=A0ABQ3V7U0_9CHLR|nr:hypothetical protein [Ktedonobacter robiniae]GHO61033.1 hypothetical protein KSB_95080 [Ktedonobacter robiniae]